MLCEIALWGNFFATWLLLSLLAMVGLLLMSGALFYRDYIHASFESWKQKINPDYPSAEKVRDEIRVMLGGLLAATLCPSLALTLAQKGISQAYCGITPPSTMISNVPFGLSNATWLVLSFFLSWLVSDFWEFFYHWAGHRFAPLWNVHKVLRLIYVPKF